MVKKIIQLLIVVITINIISCATIPSEKLAQYKKITKNIDVANQNEVLLAQHLYNEMLKNK
tara:strand:+ start:1391 stop:1573 length:183 start_codon:yes stop_codon:yes gene_type:complete